MCFSVPAINFFSTINLGKLDPKNFFHQNSNQFRFLIARISRDHCNQYAFAVFVNPDIFNESVKICLKTYKLNVQWFFYPNTLLIHFQYFHTRSKYTLVHHFQPAKHFHSCSLKCISRSYLVIILHTFVSTTYSLHTLSSYLLLHTKTNTSKLHLH